MIKEVIQWITCDKSSQEQKINKVLRWALGKSQPSLSTFINILTTFYRNYLVALQIN